MKCLSLWQPWASLVALGEKTIETRSWATAYRGPLAIHAAKRQDESALLLCRRQPFRKALNHSHWIYPVEPKNLPYGALVAVCTLVDCCPTEHIRMDDQQTTARLKNGQGQWVLSAQEAALGDYTFGRYAWLLSDIRCLCLPIPYRGAQGLFTVPDDLPGLGA